MRPRLQVLEPPLLASIVDEAKRTLDEVGMEIRGAKMRQQALKTLAWRATTLLSVQALVAASAKSWFHLSGLRKVVGWM